MQIARCNGEWMTILSWRFTRSDTLLLAGTLFGDSSQPRLCSSRETPADRVIGYLDALVAAAEDRLPLSTDAP
jgi:hypothetical protein